MSLEVKTTCPLGSECEKIVDGVIHRCAWYVTIKGKNPQDNTDIDESRCAIAWQPILAIEQTATAVHTNQSIQSMRNETIKRQEIAMGALDGLKRITNQ